jgi:hypothetical protein
MRPFSTVLLALSLILVFSYSRGIGVIKQNEVDSWLNTILGDKPPELDITGKWHDEQGSTFFGWGEGYLRQEGNEISGALGDYNIKGVVSGQIVYLVFLYKNTVYYTARLEMFQGSLRGNYFKGNDKEQTKGYPTSLARTVEPAKQ